MTSNEQVRRIIREAFVDGDAKTFGIYARLLLERGYETKLGKRGGISFSFIGVGEGVRPEAWRRVGSQFAPHFTAAKKQFCEHGQYRSLCPACSPLA